MVIAEGKSDASPWLTRSTKIQFDEAHAFWRNRIGLVGQPRPMLGRLP
jgi:hypothetical protein